MTSGRSASAPVSGNCSSSSSSGFSYVDSFTSYRSGELSVGSAFPVASASQPMGKEPVRDFRYRWFDDWRQNTHYIRSSGRGKFSRKLVGAAVMGVAKTENVGNSGRALSTDRMSDLYLVEREKSWRKGYQRGASMSVSGSDSPCSSPQCRSSCDTRQFSGRNRCVTNGSKGSATHIAEVPQLLASALSEKQAERVLTSLKNSRTHFQCGVKVKVLELLEYWMSDLSTSAVIEQLINEVYKDAGLTGDYSIVTNGTSGVLNDSFMIVNDYGCVENCAVQGEKKRSNSDRVTLSASSSSSSLSLSTEDVGCWDKEDKTGGRPEQFQTNHQHGKWGENFSSSEGNKSVDVAAPPFRRRALFMNGLSDAEVKVAGGASVLSHAESAPLTPTFFSEAYTSRLMVHDDIPCFYDSAGELRAEEETIVGPTYNRHLNPHVNFADWATVPASLHAVAADRGGCISVDEPVGRKAKAFPMVTLKAVEEKAVLPFIQKELCRLRMSTKVNETSCFLASRVNGCQSGSDKTLLQREVNQEELLIQTLQRICTQCLGLPRYFAFIIKDILYADANTRSVGVKYSRGRAVMVSSLDSLVLGQSYISQTDVIAEQLLELFETYLRGRCILRRVFEVLLLSSHVSSGGLAMSSRSCSSDREGKIFESNNQGQKRQQRSYLLPNDFSAYIRVLLNHHPGLVFLKETPDFQSRYLETVIYRIFYDLDRFGNGRITYAEMERSCFLDSLRQVDATDDINLVSHYFSYEHFYILYCRFWELDKNQDMLLSRQEFMQYVPEGLMNPIIAERVFGGVGRRTSCRVRNRINYEDFVWFCLSEEDKSTATAIRYWFRILDLDGDGVLSLYELRKIYDETMRIAFISGLNEQVVAVEDLFCQILDMFGVEASCGLRLKDLLSKPDAAAVVLNMLTNFIRFLQFEEEDPFVAYQKRLYGSVEESQ